MATTPAPAGAELLFKTLVVGDSSVGKTNLTFRYTEDRFEESPLPTVGVDFLVKETMHNHNRVKMQIWDTAGQERFKAITRSLYHGARGAMIVYDITKRDSFTHVRKWLDELRTNIPNKIPIILAGNKSDLADQRQVSQEEAEKYAREEKIAFMETSALASSNVDSAFEWLIAEMCAVLTATPQPNTHTTAPNPTPLTGTIVLPPMPPANNNPTHNPNNRPNNNKNTNNNTPGSRRCCKS